MNEATRAVLVNGRIRKAATPKYRAWQKTAKAELEQQYGRLPDLCYWRADILIPGHRTRVDLDNMNKGILDALGAAGKTPDDRHLVDLRVRFYSGEVVKIAVQQEDLHTWAMVKKASRSLIQKLARSYR